MPKMALKQWAVVLAAMAAGEQIFLLRKGGIAEGKQGFEMKHGEFLFFPTWEHQQVESIKPACRGLFEGLESTDAGSLKIRYAGRVADVVRAPDSIETMGRLDGLHVWDGVLSSQALRIPPGLAAVPCPRAVAPARAAGCDPQQPPLRRLPLVGGSRRGRFDSRVGGDSCR
jgi:hypothetical protein